MKNSQKIFNFKSTKIKNLIFIILIVAFFSILYLYKLNSIPTNLTGDEMSYLKVVYQALYGPQFLNPFQLMEDHTKTVFNFYWMGLWIKIFGLNNTVFAMRFAISTVSIGALIVFYLLLKNRSNNFTAFSTTILLGTSVWFMNFSRSGWFNLVSVFFGLLMIYFFEKALKDKSLWFFLLSGFIGGLCLYSYLSGYIFPASAFTFLMFSVILGKDKISKLLHTVFYFSGFLIPAIPLIIMAFKMKNDYLLRPDVVFAFNKAQPFIHTFLIQLTDVLKGLVLLDGGVIGKSFENPRYFPIHQSAVDPIIRTLFISGLLFYTYKFFKKPYFNIWILIFIITLGTVGLMTVDSPNLARTIPILPCIYFLSGVIIFNAYETFKKTINQKVILALFVILTFLIAANNIHSYFKWAQDDQTAAYRYPFVSYENFPSWQKYQIILAKQGILQ